MGEIVKKEELVPGIYEGLSFEDYLALPALNNSGITELMRSPLHYWSRFLDPQREREEPTPAMKLGTAIHTAILEPNKFDDRYAIEPEDAPKRPTEKQINAKKPSENTLAAIAFWEEFDAKVGDRDIITRENYKKVQRIGYVVRDHPAAQVLFSDGKPEVTVIGKDPETGVVCKIRIDWLAGAMALDLKSTIDASPRQFPKSIANYGYHRQAAFYKDVFLWATGYPLEAFIFAAYEKDAPFGCAHYEPDQDLIEQGRREFRPMLRLFADCLSSCRWPGYPEEIQKIALPKWALTKDKEF